MKKFVASSKWRPFWKFWIIKHSFNLTSDMKRTLQIMPKKISWWWVTLALISSIANYLKYNYFCDCDGIDNDTLRLWIFSDFCSRHTVGVAGDDIMFHILVITRVSEVVMFSPCVFVCLCVCVSMFVTMFVRTIWLWRTGATQTIFCRYIVGDV